MVASPVTDDHSSGSHRHCYATIEQLRELIKEIAGGGRGKIDSQELFEAHFLADLELPLYETLRAKYPELSVTDAVVCRAAYIDIKTISGTYRHMIDRMPVWTYGTIPESEWPRFVYENKNWLMPKEKRDQCNSEASARMLLEEVIEKMFRDGGHIGQQELFPPSLPLVAEYAMGKAYKHGYLQFTVGESHVDTDWLTAAGPPDTIGEDGIRVVHHDSVITPRVDIALREDITKTLDKLVEEISAESDAKLIAEGQGEELERLQREYESGRRFIC